LPFIELFMPVELEPGVFGTDPAGVAEVEPVCVRDFLDFFFA
jgi:hypothetical protein